MSLLYRERKQRFGAAFPFIALAISTQPAHSQCQESFPLASWIKIALAK